MDIRKRLEIGARIRRERLKRNWDIPTLAKRASLPARRLVMLEEGAAELSTRLLVVLAEAMETSTDSLLYDNAPAQMLCLTPDVRQAGEQILRDAADIIRRD